MTRRALALAVVLAAIAALAAVPAAPAAILAPQDAAELANALAEASAEQEVCYGWAFEVSDAAGSEDGPEVGSNLGPGVPVDPSLPECARYAVLTGAISYTSELSESEDRAVWSVESNLPDPPSVDRLEKLGYSSNDLLGDQNDLAIINATGALPALVAEGGAADPVPFEQTRREPGVGGQPTGSPGSDFLRQNGSLLAISALLILGGLVWLVRLHGRDRRSPSRPRPAETSTHGHR